MDWVQLAQIAGSGAAVGLLSTIFGWLTSRNKNRAEASKISNEAAKVTTDSNVAQSADYRAWAERADKRAERAEARLDAAEQAAREARNKAAAVEIELGNARDELADVHKRLDRLISAIQACSGGSAGCPVAASIGQAP